VPYHDPRLPSICPLIPSATLYERELIEMFGFVIEDTPDPARLLLPDDWPDGVYPLRKAFEGLGA
jgi:Ni,Fe-hydrogenase III component G